MIHQAISRTSRLNTARAHCPARVAGFELRRDRGDNGNPRGYGEDTHLPGTRSAAHKDWPYLPGERPAPEDAELTYSQAAEVAWHISGEAMQACIMAFSTDRHPSSGECGADQRSSTEGGGD